MPQEAPNSSLNDEKYTHRPEETMEQLGTFEKVVLSVAGGVSRVLLHEKVGVFRDPRIERAAGERGRVAAALEKSAEYLELLQNAPEVLQKKGWSTFLWEVSKRF